MKFILQKLTQKDSKESRGRRRGIDFNKEFKSYIWTDTSSSSLAQNKILSKIMQLIKEIRPIVSGTPSIDPIYYKNDKEENTEEVEASHLASLIDVDLYRVKTPRVPWAATWSIFTLCGWMTLKK